MPRVTTRGLQQTTHNPTEGTRQEDPAVGRDLVFLRAAEVAAGDGAHDPGEQAVAMFAGTISTSRLSAPSPSTAPVARSALADTPALHGEVAPAKREAGADVLPMDPPRLDRWRTRSRQARPSRRSGLNSPPSSNPRPHLGMDMGRHRRSASAASSARTVAASDLDVGHVAVPARDDEAVGGEPVAEMLGMTPARVA